VALRGANGRFVKIKDNGYDALIKRITDARTARKVTIGIHEEEGSELEGDGGLTVAEVGALHEFGLGGQEQRSFVRAFVDENEAQIGDDLRKIGDAVLAGKIESSEQGLERFGLKTAGDMQMRIRNGGVTPADKPSTIAKKGSSITLIDDGILWTKITHKVEK